MKTLLNPYFLLGCAVWLVNFTLRRLHHPLPYVNGYITDTFALPVIANLGLWFQRVIIYKNNNYILKPGHVIFVVIYVAFVFEWLMPRYSNKYTADWADVVLYIAGGYFFYKIMNKPTGLTAI
jgi:hypothetical protein